MNLWSHPPFLTVLFFPLDSKTGAEQQSTAAPQEEEASTSPPPPKKITVQVISKEVQLPTNEATLTAYAVPKATEDQPYDYQWKLVSFTRKGGGSSSEPSGASDGGNREGNMQKSHSPTLELTGLEQGVYQFKVTVDSKEPQMHGEALANVSVLPRESVALYLCICAQVIRVRLRVTLITRCCPPGRT